KHRLPKLGENLTVKIMRHLANLSQNVNHALHSVGTIVNSWRIITSEGDYAKKIGSLSLENLPGFWIRISGNYWYNGFDRLPYYGTQIAYVPRKECSLTASPSDFLILLVNSSLFYVWSRVYGDGRHLNADILKAFPLPSAFQAKLQKYAPLMVLLKTTLMKALFATFDPKYNRFATSRIKVILDVVDLFLGHLYGLSLDLITHIQVFESEIRGGNQLPLALARTLSKYLLTIASRDISHSDIGEFQRILVDLEDFPLSTAIN
ncbi:MAG: hypothetical protein KAR20_00180, partial [Candidatus Heimdallarchaeota archaeon]|nr:hypothetical protein [Candidatus Heimdallarchaeota archaeon]